MAEAPVEFSIAVLCYRAEEGIIPFVENLHNIMSLFRFAWKVILVANFWQARTTKHPRSAKSSPKGCPMYACSRNQRAVAWDGTCDADWTPCPRQIHRRDRRRRAVSSRGDIFLLRQDKERRFRLCKNAPRPAPRRPLSNSDFSRLQLAFSYPLPRLGQISGRELEPKIMTREAYRKMVLQSNDWFIDAELILNCIKGANGSSTE